MPVIVLDRAGKTGHDGAMGGSVIENGSVGGIPTLPATPADVARVAEVLGFDVPDACMPGVVANLALLRGHADILLGRTASAGA